MTLVRSIECSTTHNYAFIMVLAITSVCHSPILYQNEWTYDD